MGLDFYNAIAGLIPILVLAVGLEMREIEGTLKDAPRGAGAVVLVTFLLVFAMAVTAEGLVLAVLKNGGASETMESLVNTSLVGVAALFITTTLGPRTGATRLAGGRAALQAQGLT